MSNMVEITEEDLAYLQKAEGLMKKLHDNKATRPLFDKAVKAHPELGKNYVSAEDVADPIVAPMKEQISKLEKRLQAKEDAEMDSHLNSTFKEVQQRYGYTDEGMGELKKMMVDKNIADPEVAAAYWEKKNPPKATESNGFASTAWKFEETADKDENSLDRLWFTDPNGAIDQIITEERNKQRK